jgi:hypothetical protein
MRIWADFPNETWSGKFPTALTAHVGAPEDRKSAAGLVRAHLNAKLTERWRRTAVNPIAGLDRANHPNQIARSFCRWMRGAKAAHEGART